MIGRHPAGFFQSDRHQRRDAAVPIQYIRKSFARDAKTFGRIRYRQLKRHEAIFPNDFAGMGRIEHFHHLFLLPFNDNQPNRHARHARHQT